jgi:diaminopimelate epimerase
VHRDFPRARAQEEQEAQVTRFAKAHGLGNDFLLVDAQDAPREGQAQWARCLCERHTGVGADGVIVYHLDSGGVGMRLLNADGSDAEISGNGLRCLASFVVAGGWLPSRHRVFTAAGPRDVEVQRLGENRYRVLTDLGVPVLASSEIPVALEPAAPRVVDHPLKIGDVEVSITASSLGNPHCALFLDAPAEDAFVARLGPALEVHPFFPRKTNVEFVTVLGRDTLRVRLWERGVGRTRSSGTGAASAAVAAILKGEVDRRVRVVCDGGVLEVSWNEGGSVEQVGEAQIVFEGQLP